MKLARRQGVPAGLWIALAAIAVAAPFIGSSPAVAVVPPPQFNCVQSQATSFVNPADVTIPDPPDLTTAPVPVTSTIVVSGATGKIYDVDVLTRIPHAAPVDLDITLTAPNGKIVELSIGNGGIASNAFNGTTWDDDADPDGASTATANDGLVTDHNYVPGAVASPLVPQEALAALVGDDPNGVWKLTVADTVPTEVGVIDEWSLLIATDVSSPPFPSAVSSATAPALTIVDGGTVTSSVKVTSTNHRLRSLSARFTDFAVTGFGDLTLTLQSPAGTIVTLTSRNGGDIDIPAGPLDWRIPAGTFTGSGKPDPISRVDFAQAGVPFTVAPEESFGAFHGEDPNGTWTLSATDAGLLAGAGTLGGWSIRAELAECAGGAELTTFTGPASGSRIGESVTYEATTRSVGVGLVHDIETVVSLPRTFRITGVDPGPSGLCSPSPGSFTERRCAWKGPTAPGTLRTMRVIGEAFVAGVLEATVRTSASRGVRSVGVITPSLFATATLGPVTASPSTRRAFNGRRCTVLGTPGADTFQRFTRTLGPQVFCGLQGNDRIEGSASNDVIDGGAGNDLIRGGQGDDRIAGGTGRDTLIGGPGADDLRGGPGADRLLGLGGRDLLAGGPGTDTLIGGLGNDVAFGGAGDVLLGIERVR